MHPKWGLCLGYNNCQSFYGRIIISRGRIIIPLPFTRNLTPRTHINIECARNIIPSSRNLISCTRIIASDSRVLFFRSRGLYVHLPFWNCILCSQKSMMCSWINILCERVTIPYALNLISCARIINYYSVRSTSYL